MPDFPKFYITAIKWKAVPPSLHYIIQIMLLQHLRMQSAKECHRVLLPMEDRVMREWPNLIGEKFGMLTVIG